MLDDEFPKLDKIRNCTSTPAGLYRTPQGRLKLPWQWITCNSDQGLNVFFQPCPTIGDYVANALPTRKLTATAGVLESFDGQLAVVRQIDGQVYTMSDTFLAVVTKEQYEEIKADVVSGIKEQIRQLESVLMGIV